MSYILEAMRRAESDRHRGEVPLLNESTAPAAEPIRSEPASSRLGLLWSALIGLGIGFAGYALLRHFVSSPPASPTAPVAAAPAAGVGAGGALTGQTWGGNGQVPGAGSSRGEAVARPSAPAAKPDDATLPPLPPTVQSQPATPAVPVDGKAAPGSVKPKPATDGSSSQRPQVSPAGTPSRSESRGAPEGAPAAGPAQAKAAPAAALPRTPRAAPSVEGSAPQGDLARQSDAAATTATAPSVAVATPPAGAALPRVRDLPPDLQRDVPPLLVSGWVQSADPGSRQLLVNGVLLREGDALTPVLRLEMIGRRTAVFSVRGQRFEVPISL